MSCDTHRVWVTMSCDMHRSGSQCHVTRTDLTLSFMNPRLLDDVSFHPCVRFKRWEGGGRGADNPDAPCVTNVSPLSTCDPRPFVGGAVLTHLVSCTLVGMATYDPVEKNCSLEDWQVEPTKEISMSAHISLTAGEVPDGNPTIMVDFKISQFAASGLKVNRLDVNGEKYKPFKGIKYYTKAGKFQVRS
eukprot:Em0016g37a